MKFTSLDKITRSVLTQRSLPIHYYFKYLKHAADCFRELHYDTLRVVNTKLLPASSTGIVELPCDYVDFVKVGIAVGQMVKPLHQQSGINRLPKRNAQGQIESYPASPPVGTPAWDNHTNEIGEGIGRFFAFHDGLLTDTYKVLPERNCIQLNQSLGATEIILEYISDGSYCDAATKVDPLAQATIEDYMKWQVSRNADNPQSPEAVKYWGSYKKLRARKNPLTIADIKRIFHKAVTPTIK